MPDKVKVTKIFNLTKKVEFTDAAELKKFVMSAASDSATGSDLDDTKNKDFALATDNIEVTWTDAADNVHRGVGGTFKLVGKEATITGLVDVSQYSVGITGVIDIGPKAGNVAHLSVSIGNLNKDKEWIIDFSDKNDKATGSEIDVAALIAWIKEKNSDLSADAALPPVEDASGKSPDIQSFKIEFKKFYYNITRKTFDFWVASKAGGGELKFGDFEIKSVGFRVTNVPPDAEPVKVADKDED